jgi:dienelactone hydrolase
MKRLLLPLLAFCLCLGPLLAKLPREASCEVKTWESEWTDASRGRTIPFKVYYPDLPAGQPAPVIVFSHGLGGSRETYAYLGRYWAAHGYVAVHIQHPGSDTKVMGHGINPLRKLRKLKEAVADPENIRNRPLDLRFAIDELELAAKAEGNPLKDRLDLNRVAIAGHSFGAFTVMAVAGQRIGPEGLDLHFGPDPRVKAAIAMSSQAPASKDLDAVYATIRLPIFHMTGTRDQLGPMDPKHANPEGLGATDAAQRRVAYDHTLKAPALLLTFEDGDHMVFSGRGRLLGGEHDKAYQQLICLASTAFWDATLRGDEDARAWLANGGFEALLGSSGRLEKRGF